MKEIRAIMEKIGGYNGKILRVNLTDNNVYTQAIDELFCRKYLGGAGFVTYFLWKELQQGIDPLGPDNKLIFALGPVTGVPLSGSGRHCVGAKSPLTGGYAKAESGGFWGAELKHAGFDAVIIEGKAEKPVYLWIHDGEISIRDAGHLWGENTKETQETIRTELGDSLIRVAVIGPAGENLVRFACIINDLKHAAGRGGLGAVMGSKNLKAIAVRGHNSPQVVEPEQLKSFTKWLSDNKKLWAELHDVGTLSMMESYIAAGNTPVRNFQDGEFPEITNITAQTIRDTIRIGMESCYGCMVRCKKVVKVDEPYSVDPAYGGPEYETLAGIGSNCGISDLKAIARGNQLCGAYSLDTIATGNVISFAMQCFESGLLTAKDTGGIELRFGNVEAMLKTIELIARHQGIGILLAEGTGRAAQKIGRGAAEFAMNVKGVEIPMHDPRAKAAMGLGYVINPHGADHNVNMHDPAYAQPGRAFDRIKALGILEPLPTDDLGPRKVAVLRYEQLFRIAQDSLVMCQFVPFDISQAAEILSAVTGWKTSIVELMRVSERILTMARLFNTREGLSAADDKLPNRFFQPKRNGILSTKFYDPEQLDKAKSYYYTLMGWDRDTGIPMPEKVEELELA
jgi:aldehyde:ferredoxin oxidoreductase